MPFSVRRPLRSRALAPDRYLTDGRRLLRVLARFDDGRSVMVLVEDCCTLDAYAYALVELRAMRFREVGVSAPAPRTVAPPAEAAETLREGTGQAAV
ncbi:MAG: hypothetical protein JOY56_15675 [Solirubrobacterales bacterium]|nr:hypothetical protein [Solirubrobacterales bacterium]MBV8947359.1 hypothetical protein [Solirubrobacterales bacterium]MBV9366040.1 hypothetical protein [Solirubrobacterales bacterium]MBV9807265.1 hypothetical protein [Solirubrobacterales bacterium]